MHKFLCCLLSGLLAVAAVCLPIGSSVAAEQQISRTGITIPEDTDAAVRADEFSGK